MLFLTQVVDDALTKLEDGNATEEARVNCLPYFDIYIYIFKKNKQLFILQGGDGCLPDIIMLFKLLRN